MTPELVSETEGLRAQICDCGTVHLSIGPMTLRFSAASFERLFKMVCGVRERLEARGLLPKNEAQVTTSPTPIACA